MAEREVDEQKRSTLRRFAALGAVGPFAGLDGGEVGESDTRETIARYLAATPGAHLSKIRDDLGLATGETQYHLRRLEGESVVESRRDGDYLRFFPARRFDEGEKVALGYLRRETPRGMVITLLCDAEVTASDLASRLGVSRPTVSKHAAELEAAGLLTRDGGYALVRPELLFTLLVRYADSFDARTMRFASEADELIRVA